jgi:hypothetical protein
VERFCDREHRLRLISAIRSFAMPAGNGRRRGTEQRHRTRSYARLIFQILRCDLSDKPTALRTTTTKQIAMAIRKNMESPMRTKKVYLKIEISIATPLHISTPARLRYIRHRGFVFRGRRARLPAASFHVSDTKPRRSVPRNGC